MSRILLRLMYSNIAESVCVLESLRVLTELSQDGVLNSPLKKKNLLTRMEVLALNTLLIPVGYPYRTSRNDWVERHFKVISSYIRDRESWLLAPQQNTLENLRDDFYRLTKFYLIGLYGEFRLEEVGSRLEENQKFSNQVSKTFRLIGYLLPPSLMLIILANPSINPGFNEDLLSLFCMAWILIGIDRYLNLGIIDSTLTLAKGLKDLG